MTDVENVLHDGEITNSDVNINSQNINQHEQFETGFTKYNKFCEDDFFNCYEISEKIYMTVTSKFIDKFVSSSSYDTIEYLRAFTHVIVCTYLIFLMTFTHFVQIIKLLIRDICNFCTNTKKSVASSICLILKIFILPKYLILSVIFFIGCILMCIPLLAIFLSFLITSVYTFFAKHAT